MLVFLSSDVKVPASLAGQTESPQTFAGTFVCMDDARATGSAEPAAVRAVAALADPSRRRLYALVSEAVAPVTREQAADELGISRKLAAFHLDKLVDAGLLVADYPPGSRVRPLGRVPKAYMRAEIQVDISIPERQPGILAALLVNGIAGARVGEPARDAVLRAAKQEGRNLAAAARAESRPGRLGPERALTLAEAVLRGRGYQPRREASTCIRLRNCPFRPLSERSSEFICLVNLRLLEGLVAGMGAQGVEAVLAPRARACCVELRPT